MEGLSDFYRLYKYQNKEVEFCIDETKESWDRSCEDGDDIYDSAITKLNENHIFDNVYLSKQEKKLAFISIIENNNKLFLPFYYSYTGHLRFRDMRRDITRKLRGISVNNLSIIVPEKIIKKYIEPIKWKEDSRHHEVLVDQKKSFLMKLEDFNEKEVVFYKLFD
jgi:hypothetical protein